MTTAKFILLSTVVLVWSGVACAQTDSGSWGRNRLNQTVGILPGTIYTYENDGNGRRTGLPVSEAPFVGECTWIGSSDSGALDCRDGRASPLAGSYFKIRFSETHRNECGRGSIIYECTSGCQPPRVPRVFIAEPYEC
jgi:hypothetical protein